MTPALAEREPVALTVTADQLDLVKKTIATGATDAELKLFLYDCGRQGVHPLDRLLHFTKRGGKYTPVTSIDLMRIRAAETGDYAGSDDAVFAAGSHGAVVAVVVSASVTVWRLVQGTRCPFTATARWSEYCPAQGQDHMWRKMPHTMLAKCAEALALRKGFPRQLAGLYAREELDQAGTNGYAVEPLPAPAASEGAQVRPVEGSRENAAAGPAGDSARPPDANAYATGDFPEPPEGAVYLASVKKGFGKAAGELTTHQGEVFPIFKDELMKLAEQLCQARAAVYLDTAVSKTSGKAYATGLRTASDIPF